MTFRARLLFGLMFLSLVPFSASRADTSNTKLSTELEQALNTQIRHELEASYLYLDMANYFEQQSLFGFSHWFSVQFFEEVTHARRMMKFLADKGNTVKLEDVRSAGKVIRSPLEAAKVGLAAEEEQSGRIQTLYQKARDAKAYDLETFMAWFVKDGNDIASANSAGIVFDIWPPTFGVNRLSRIGRSPSMNKGGEMVRDAC